MLSESSTLPLIDEAGFTPRTRIKTVVRISNQFSNDDFIKIGVETDHGVEISIDGTATSVRVKKAFDAEATNKDVYDSLVHKAVDRCTRGLDYYMMTYGSKGSGKTHSIFGSEKSKGLLTLFVENLDKKKICADSNLCVGFSFFELKQHLVFDCLSDAKSPKSLRIRFTQQPIDAFTEYRIKSIQDFKKLFHYATLRRASYHTEFCESDAVSNVCACITVRRKIKEAEKEKNLISRTYFFDLPGTPANTSESELDRDLASFHTVVDKVVFRSSPNFHTSVLVRFLEPFLTGHTLGCVLGILNPSAGHQKEAIECLNFLWQLSKIMTTPEVGYVNESKENIVYPGNFDPKTFDDEWDQLTHPCMLNPPNAPCLVEIFSDYSLSYWHLLGTFKTTLKLLDKTPLLDVSIDSTSAHNAEVRSTYGVLEVNANTVEQGNIKSARHLDILAINGIRLFVLLLNDAWTPLDLEKNTVFMRYVRLVSRKVKEELNAQIKKETQEDFAMLTKEITSEVLAIDNEFHALKNKANDTELDAEELAELTDTLTMLRDDRANRTSLHQVVKERIANIHDVLNVDDNSDSEEVVRIRALVDNANSSLKHIGCNNFSFSQNVFNSSGELCVRLCDHEKKLFANFSLKVFKKLYVDVYALYQQKSEVSSFQDHFSKLLFATDVNWFATTEAGRSTILTEHVRNSMQETAIRRDSSIAQLQDSFSKRNSVITRLSMGRSITPTTDDEELIHHVLNYLDNDPKIPECDDPFKMLLDALAELYNQFSFFRIAENLEDISAQKKALIFSSIFKFYDQIDTVNQLMRYYYVITQETMDLCLTLDVAFEQLSAFNTIFRTWVRTIVESEINHEHAVKSLRFVLDNVTHDLGSYVFSIGIYLPVSDTGNYDAFKEVFTAGLLNMAESFIDTLQDAVERNRLPMRVFKRILIAHTLRELYKYIGTKTNFNADFYLEIFTPVVRFYELCFTKNYYQITAAKFVMIQNRIQNHFSSIVKEETLDVFKNVISTLTKHEEEEIEKELNNENFDKRFSYSSQISNNDGLSSDLVMPEEV